MIELSSAAFTTLTKNASQFWHQAGTTTATASEGNSPDAVRQELRHIVGNVKAVIFDFDGTLTSTPGDLADRRSKVAELSGRAPMLAPLLRTLREADLTLGIMSKSSTETLHAALECEAATALGFRDIFNGPVLGSAIGFEGKAGFIRELCKEGALDFLGAAGTKHVLLVDDDLHELSCAREHGLQTYPVAARGGLQEEDFHDIFRGLGIEAALATFDNGPDAIKILWTCGMTGRSGDMAPEPTQVSYEPEAAPSFSDYYDVDKDKLLGQGSFGWLRPGVHKQSGKPVAIKYIRKAASGRRYLKTFVEDDMYTFLLRMATDHPHVNILRQFDYLMGGTIIYNAMELLSGSDLLTFLMENAPITEASCQSIIFEVVSGLQHIHAVMGVGLIHRDVKLENLRFRSVEADSSLVLVDFGLCCAAKPDNKMQDIVGTLPYMAPEIFARDYNTQVDTWAVGLILYVILTGKLPWMQNPWQGFDKEEVGAKAVEGAIDYLRCQRPAQGGIAPVPEEVEFQRTKSPCESPPLAIDLLSRLLVIDPEKRFSATEALGHAWLCSPLTAIGSSRGGRLLKVSSSEYLPCPKQALEVESPEAGVEAGLMTDLFSCCTPRGSRSVVSL